MSWEDWRDAVELERDAAWHRHDGAREAAARTWFGRHAMATAVIVVSAIFVAQVLLTLALSR